MSDLHVGTTEACITAAERELGVTFPEALKQLWVVHNGLELPAGWRVLPVFDPAYPRKTAGHIVYENTRARWPYMADDLLVIARGDTGNCLVLRRDGSTLDPTILHWNHETNRTKAWGKTFETLLAIAQKRIAEIEKARARGMGKRG